jgi:hypothetical protein
MGLKLHGEVSLDGSGFEKGLHKLEHAGHHAFEGLKEMAVAAFGFYGVEAAIHKTIETAEELVNTSKRMDTTIEQLQLIKQAAKDSGTELGAVAGAIEKINIAREKIARGDKESAKLLADFKALGVTPAMLKSQTGAGLLTGPIAQTARSRNVADVSLQLREILGKGFGEILPLLRTDMEELDAQMRKMGLIMDTDTAVKLHTLGNELSLMSQLLVVQLGPALVSFVRVIIEAIGGMKMLASFAGGVTSRVTGNDIFKFISGADQGAIFKKIFSKDTLRDGLKEAIKTGDTWEGMLQAIDEKMREEAEKLKHPTPPTFDTGADAAGKKGRAMKEGDALVRVGNFLGSAGAAAGAGPAQQIVHIQQKHLAISQRQLQQLEMLNLRIGMMAAIFPM